MARFHNLKISDIRRETADCVSVAFEIPAQLAADFQYTQGQYVTLKLMVNGEELRRSYSICSSPVADQELRIAAKKVKDGRGSGFINDLMKIGDVVEVMTPMGNFHTALSADNQKNYVLFAGGSGITPMLSILKSVLKTEPQSSVTLFYGNLDENATIFKNDIDRLAQAESGRFSVYYIFDQPQNPLDALYTGIMTGDKVKALIEKHVDLNADNEFFICGPTPMMKNTEEMLADMHIAKQRVHLEYFTASLEAAKADSAVTVAAGGKIVSQVTIIMDGEETTVELASDGKSVLDAAIEADLDAPFSCKGAVCCTCRAKVLEGAVRMKANFALTEEEVAEGFILTCQSHPTTPTLIVDYDV
jgi:ring-1,2-phenylacetyl-CoA epoxidase subunit PaaE